MATEIHYTAAQIGQASESRRLDPPLLMGLDEVTQICPVPLPSWLSDSGGKGIQICAVVHGEAQLTGRWGDHGRQVVLDTSSVKMFLPGITDVTTLDAAAKLCGQASWKVRGQDHATRHDVATPDMIRQLPAGFALIIRGGCAPVIARLPRAWKNPAYRRARRLGHLPAEPAAEHAAYPVFVPQPPARVRVSRSDPVNEHAGGRGTRTILVPLPHTRSTRWPCSSRRSAMLAAAASKIRSPSSPSMATRTKSHGSVIAGRR
jgi:TraM recognition site of TraD and TraG